jgi:hypothetical protein
MAFDLKNRFDFMNYVLSTVVERPNGKSFTACDAALAFAAVVVSARHRHCNFPI